MVAIYGASIVLPPAIEAFKSGSAQLGPDQRAACDALLQALKQIPNVHLVLEGHADKSEGPRAEQLSEKRARNVLERLVSQGIPRERLSARGFGAERPFADPATEEGRSKNRCVSVRVGAPE